MQSYLKGILLLLLVFISSTLSGSNAYAQSCTPTITTSGAANLCSEEPLILTASEAASYVWSTGATTRSITVTEGGSYWVKTTSADGCEATSAIFNVAAKPDASISDPIYFFTYCSFAGSDATFTLNVINTSTTKATNRSYTIIWGDGSSSTYGKAFETASHTYRSAGSFDLVLTVTSDDGCTSTSSEKVFIGSNPDLGLRNRGNSVDCAPATFTFDVSGVDSNSPHTIYKFWFNDGTDTLTYTQENFPASRTIEHTFTESSNGKPGNSFTLNAIAITPCGSTPASVGGIKVSKGPSAGLSTSKTEACIGETITLTDTSEPGFNADARPGVPTNTYSRNWSISPETGWEITSGNFTAQKPAVKFTQPGVYKVKIMVAPPAGSSAKCQGDSTETTITILSPPQANFGLTQTPENGCANNLINIINTSQGDKLTYNWAVTPTAGWSFLNGTTKTSKDPEFRFTAAGTYKITLTANNSCGPASIKDTTITVLAKPTVTLPKTTLAYCGPAIINFNAATTAHRPVFNAQLGTITGYRWEVKAISGAGEYTFENGTTAASQYPSILLQSAGVYEVLAYAINECGETTVPAKQRITINPLPALAVTAPKPAICIGESMELTVSGADTYTWEAAGGLTTTTGNKVTVSPIQTTTYTVTGTNTATGCKSSTTYTVVVNSLPEVKISSTALQICAGGTATLTASGADSFTWAPATGLNATEGATVTVNPTKTTTYTVTGLNTETGCTNTATVTIEVNPLPEVKAGADLLVCENQETVQLRGLPAGGTWSGAGTVTAEGTFTPDRKGIFELTYTFTDALGCTNSDQLTVTVSEVLIANAGEDKEVCLNSEPLHLQGAPAGGIWSGSPNVTADGIFTPDNIGTFTLTYTYYTGTCFTTDEVTVTVKPLPAAPIVANATVCYNSSATLSASGPENIFNWYNEAGTLLNTGNNFTTPALTATTSYFAEAVGTNTCASPRTKVTVTVRPATPAPEVAPVILCGPGNKATLVANGTGTTFEWYDAATGGNLLFKGKTYLTEALNANTTYYVQAVTDGCPGPRTEANVTVYPVLSANSIVDVPVICAGQTPTALTGSTMDGGDGTYSYTWQISTTGPASGFTTIKGATDKDYAPAALYRTTWYRRIVKSAACTSISDAAQVTVTPVMANNTISLSPQEEDLCQNTSAATINGSLPTGGNGTYVYTWEISTTGAEGVYTVAPGINNEQHYSPGSLTQTTWFRRKVTSGTCEEHVSLPVKINVYKPIANNSITGEQMICEAATPVALQGSMPTEGTGNYTYRWEMSTDGSNFTLATGQNNAINYNPGPLTTTTWFRRIVTGGPCGTSTSNVISVTVNPTITNNNITRINPICSGTETPTLVGSAPAGGNGDYTYRWLISTTGANGAYTAAPGLNTASNYNPGILTQTTWYKREIISGACSNISAVTEVTVVPLPAAPTVQPVTICENTGATLAVAEQTGTFQWYLQAEGGSPVGTGRSFTTQPLTETTTFYVEAVNTSGCGSAVRVPVLVTVNKQIANNTVAFAADQLLCAGQTPAIIAGTSPEGGNGTYAFRWEYSETGATTGFKTIAGAGTASYQPKALSKTTWFRRVVISGPCAENASEAVKADVVPVISQNTISSSQTICEGDTPAAFTGSAPAGGNSTYTFVWESSEDGNTFAPAAGDNTQAAYTAPGPLARTTWYRRVVSSGPCAQDISAAIKITVQPVITNNSITTEDQQICAGEKPVLLKAATPAGGNNTYSYVWESSTDGTTFAAAAGTRTNASYQPQPLIQTTWFRRKVTSGACTSYSEPIRITVNPGIEVNQISSSQTICTNTAPLELTGTQPTGGDGSYTFEWQYTTTDATGPYTPVALDGKARNYQPGVLAATTWFRRVVTSGACSDISAPVQVTVSPAIARNVIRISQSIDAGQRPSPLTGLTPTGGNGTYMYRWEMSTDNITFVTADAPNNGINYAPPALKETTWYRRVVISGGCESISEPVEINVTPFISANIIQADQVICFGNVPAPLIGSSPQGGEGNYTYLWQASTTGPDSGWKTAAGKNNEPNYSPAAVPQTTWFRRIVMSGPNSDASAPVMIIVKPAMSNNKISTSQTICYNTAPTALTGSVPTGGSGNYTYIWEMSTEGPNQNFTTAPGANNLQHYTPAPLTRNTWFRRVITSESCDRLVSNPILITVTPLPQPPVAQGATICANTTATLTATGGGGKLEWYTSASGGVAIRTGNTFTTPALTHTTTYYVQELAQTCAGERTPVTVTVEEASANAGQDVTIVHGRSAELQAGGGVKYTWSPANGLSETTIRNPIATPDVTTTYKVTVVTAAGCTFTDEVTVTVLPFVEVPNTFTPNRDGINDTWVIANIEKYPTAKVQVFNQWGNLVFSSVGYDTPWDGTLNGKELPIATYYYLIQLNDKEKPLSGSVTIVK